MNEDEFVSVAFAYNPHSPALDMRVRAKRDVTLVEIQGSRAVVDAFGATIPDGFRVRQFGEDVEVPDGMKDDIAFMNKSQFRWGCDVRVAAGSEHTIRMPAVGGAGTDTGVLTLAYEYPKMFGLLTGNGAVYVSLVGKHDS